jgi:hypothetical protein
MIGSYITLLSQELELLWHFGLVTFYYLIHRNCTLFLLAVNQETEYFAFLLTLKRGLSVSMIIVTLLYNPATSNTRCTWAVGTFLRQWKKVPPAHMQRVYLAMDM